MIIYYRKLRRCVLNKILKDIVLDCLFEDITTLYLRLNNKHINELITYYPNLSDLERIKTQEGKIYTITYYLKETIPNSILRVLKLEQINSLFMFVYQIYQKFYLDLINKDKNKDELSK